MQTSSEAPVMGRSFIRAWHALLVLFVIGLAVSGYVHFEIEGHALGPRTWGRSFGIVAGGALMLAALPALVIIPWRLTQRRRGATDAPIIVGAIVFVIFAFLSVNGAMGP